MQPLRRRRNGSTRRRSFALPRQAGERIAVAATALALTATLGCGTSDSGRPPQAARTPAPTPAAPSASLASSGDGAGSTGGAGGIPSADSSNGGADSPSAPAGAGSTGAGVTSATGDDLAATPPTSAFQPQAEADMAPAKVGIPEVPVRNEAGEPILLDETALLACAHGQFAWATVHYGAPGSARDELRAAAARARVSAVADIAGEASALVAAAESSDVDSAITHFRKLCEARGFES